MADITPARKLFDLLVSRDFDPEMLDSSGKPASDPAETEIYSFDFVAHSGKDYGTVVVMLGDDNNLEVYCSDNVGRSMEGDDKNDWFIFLEQLKNFAVRNFMSFGIKNLNRLRYSMQGQAAIKEGLFESWTGNRTTSWNGAATEARLMIRHKKNIAEGDARFRYIESLFIETADSERYKLPFKSLTGGRAMLEHVRQGGRPYDGRGNHISEMVTELAVLSRFRRANQGQIFEGDTQQLLEQVQEYQSNLQRSLKGLGTRTGYNTYFESWSPAEISEQDVVIESLKNLFVKQSIDTRIESALPLLAKIQQQGTEMKEANIFEAWVERLAEGTWSLPDTPEKQDKLVELLSKDLPVGADATNVTEQLYGLVGDDQLFDQLEELADRDANADARQVIMDRLQELSDWPEVRTVLDQLQIDPTAEMNPPEATNPADLEPMNESVLTDSTGSTFQHILNTFKRDVKDFEETGEVSDELHNALYDYYFDDMPYGTKKARDGDPYEWVADRFGADLGISGYGGNSPGVPDEDYGMERESVGDYADEYQDSLSGILKIAGVPAKQRPAPEYDHAGMEENKENSTGQIVKKLLDPVAQGLAGGGGGKSLSIPLVGEEETDEGILGTLGGGAIGTMLGGPLGGIVGAGLGQHLTKGGSALVEKDDEEDDDSINPIVPALAGGALGYAAGSGALDGIGSSIGSALSGLVGEQETDEGWKGAAVGGALGTVGGEMAGSALGPIGRAVGGALGGTAGTMIGNKLGGPDEDDEDDEEDELIKMKKAAGIHEDEQLNEFIGPALAAGARALMPLLSKIGPAIGKMAGQGAQVAGQAAKSAAPVVGQVAKQGAQAVGQVAKQGAEIAAKNAVPIGVGVGAYQGITDLASSLGTGVGEVYHDIGSAAEAITKAVGTAVDGKTIGDLASAAVKYAIPIGLLLALLYGGKKLIDAILGENQEQTDEGLVGAALGGIGGALVGGPAGAIRGASIGNSIGDAMGGGTTDEAIDPKNPRDYERPTIQRNKQGQAPLTRKDVEQKDRRAEFDFYQRAHGKPHPDSATKESRSSLAGQYGHSGKMQAVDKDTSFLDRLKELSGMKK